MDYRFIFIPALSLISFNALAEEAPAAAPVWKASAELGYVSTSGNTVTDTLNFKASAETERENWRHKIDLTALQSSDELGTTAEKYTLTGQSDYKLKKPNYLFVNVNYEEDKFSGYQYQVAESIGYGRRVVENETTNLDLEIGPGARQSKLDDGTSGSESTIRAAMKLNWKISKTSEFSEVLSVESGDQSTITKSVTGLSSKINSSLSMKITYTYKNTSDVPADIEETDTETAVTLVYKF